MKMNKFYLIALVFLLLGFLNHKVKACSMYKITADGKTMVGCNHDTWFATPKIWFVTATNPDEYGACFTGARQVGKNRTAPQSGMNESGLAFSRLVAYYPKQNNPFPDRLKIGHEVEYLTAILQKCATVDEVRKYIEQYDHSLFIDDVFIYVDSTGNYLVVEPYTLIDGSEQHYVLSNFCPSITDNQQARQLIRYRNGEDFIKTHEVGATLAYCAALSDTMHVCRSRNGDGTLLTSVWDTKDRVVNLYFYHRFDSTVQFNLTQELAKGDHVIDVAGIFPVNPEFERLKNYKTPFNTPVLRMLLVVMAGLLAFSVGLFSLAAWKGKSTTVTFKHTLLIAAFHLTLIGYLFVLATNVNIYYFDAPYEHYASGLISASSYTPFLLLFAMVPIGLYTINRLKSVSTQRWIKAVLVFNHFIYILLITGFGYWGLYSIWN
jgi:hypothetical protein